MAAREVESGLIPREGQEPGDGGVCEGERSGDQPRKKREMRKGRGVSRGSMVTETSGTHKAGVRSLVGRIKGHSGVKRKQTQRMEQTETHIMKKHKTHRQNRTEGPAMARGRMGDHPYRAETNVLIVGHPLLKPFLHSTWEPGSEQ